MLDEEIVPKQIVVSLQSSHVGWGCGPEIVAFDEMVQAKSYNIWIWYCESCVRCGIGSGGTHVKCRAGPRSAALDMEFVLWKPCHVWSRGSNVRCAVCPGGES